MFKNLYVMRSSLRDLDCKKKWKRRYETVYHVLVFRLKEKERKKRSKTL